MHHLAAFTFAILICTNVYSQKGISEERSSKRVVCCVEDSDDQIEAIERAIATLEERGKSLRATNNNNGRSNRDRCCKDGIAIPTSDAGYVGFDLNSKWFSERGSIPNPIKMLSEHKDELVANVYSQNGKYVTTIPIVLTGRVLIMDKSGIPSGKNYIEVEHKDSIFRTGFELNAKDKGRLIKKR